MDVLIHCVWHVEIHHHSDIDKIESSAKYTCADHHVKVSIQKTLWTQQRKSRNYNLTHLVEFCGQKF